MGRNVHPHLEILSRLLVDKCKSLGILVIITDTLRTLKEQQDRYTKGRSVTGEILTYNRPKDSYHNYGLAFDFECFAMKDSIFINKKYEDIYYEVGRIGKSIGLLWGGDSMRLCDYNHFTLNYGLSIENLKLGDNDDKLNIKPYKYYILEYDTTVRVRPNIFSGVISVLESGNYVRVLKIGSKWVQIDFLNGTYYILKSCLRLP